MMEIMVEIVIMVMVVMLVIVNMVVIVVKTGRDGRELTFKLVFPGNL